MKDTLIVQLLPPPRLMPQLLVWASLRNLWLTAMFEIFNVAFPVFERVIVCGALVVPVFC